MNIAEILRKLADIADHNADAGRPDERIQNPAELGPVPGGLPVAPSASNDAGEDDEVMVPPLQLKLELLKRAVGVDNIYDDQRADDVEDSSNDEIMTLKKNAGVPMAAVMELDNDELLDD